MLKGMAESVSLRCRPVPHSSVAVGEKLGGGSLNLEARRNLQRAFTIPPMFSCGLVG